MLVTSTTNMSTGVTTEDLLDGESLDSWATSNKLGLLYKPEEVAGFSHRRNVDTIPDLTFASVG